MSALPRQQYAQSRQKGSRFVVGKGLQMLMFGIKHRSYINAITYCKYAENRLK